MNELKVHECIKKLWALYDKFEDKDHEICGDAAKLIDELNRRTQPENKPLSLETLLEHIHAIPEETFVGTYGDFDLVKSVKDSCCEAIEEFYAYKPEQEEK